MIRRSSLSEHLLSCLEALTPGRPIAVDCDGVILDFDHAFPVVASHTLGRAMPRLNRIYELDVRYGLSSEELTQVLDAYHTHPQGWRGLPMIDGAATVLRALRELGHPLHLVTGIELSAAELRLENLRVHGIEIDDIHCVGAGRRSKREVLSRLSPGMFFDDRLHLVAEAHEVPHRVWIDRNDDQEGLECPNDVIRCTSLAHWFEDVFHPARASVAPQATPDSSAKGPCLA